MIVDINEWIAQVKAMEGFDKAGMILCHNGVVRGTTREGVPVNGMTLEADESRIQGVLDIVMAMPGIFTAKVWVNQGELGIGDDIMYALVAGDIRDNVIAGLRELVASVKRDIVREIEHYE